MKQYVKLLKGKRSTPVASASGVNLAFVRSAYFPVDGSASVSVAVQGREGNVALSGVCYSPLVGCGGGDRGTQRPRALGMLA